MYRELILSPAYSREYKNNKEVEKAFLEEGKDFLIEDFNNPYCGKPVTWKELKADPSHGYSHIHLRYKQMTKVHVLEITKVIKKEQKNAKNQSSSIVHDSDVQKLPA